MKIASRYLLIHALSGMGIVSLLLLGLQLFMLMLAELHSIGHGHYGLPQALVYVMMQLPYHCYLMLPIIVILGTLIGLGRLSNNQELLILRASGLHWYQACRQCLWSIALIVLLIFLVSEAVTPSLLRSSASWKFRLRQGTVTQPTTDRAGTWLRFHHSFIHIDHVAGPNRLVGVQEYRFDQAHRLVGLRQIGELSYQRQQWQMSDVAETWWQKSTTGESSEERTRTRHSAKGHWDVALPSDLLRWLGQDPDHLSLPGLFQAATQSQRAHLDDRPYLIAFWRRLFLPVIAWMMLLVAIPFVFSRNREAPLNHRLLQGISIGFLFHILNGIALPMSQFCRISPLVAASIPVVVFVVTVLGWQWVASNG